ncbi:hypothetical protein [Paenibacillus sp. 1_12]|nr:hypothetical protein [Paenibacillus sp. 1_12]
MRKLYFQLKFAGGGEVDWQATANTTTAKPFITLHNMKGTSSLSR